MRKCSMRARKGVAVVIALKERQRKAGHNEKK